MSKLKVLQIGKFYYPVNGGMEDHLYHLCEGLKENYDVQVIVSNTINKTVCENVDGVNVIRVARLGELLSNSICPSMLLWLRKFNPDIVHLHLPNPMSHLSYSLARPKGKLVVMWHSDIIKQKLLLKFYKPFLLNLLNRADRIIANSPAYIEHSQFLSKFKDKCSVIPLGVNLDRFTLTEEVKARSEEIKNDFGGKIILFVGRLTYYKGIEYLIEAMDNIDACLLIIGEGSLESELKRLAMNSSNSGRIFFLKGISNEDIILYYHAANVFVLPSLERSEAFGIVQLEAMACYKPVISTNLKTGVPWVNQNGKTGIIVSPRNSKALSDAVNTLLVNPELSRQYGENGRKRVEKEFTTELVTERFVSLYNELLKDEQPSSD